MRFRRAAAFAAFVLLVLAGSWVWHEYVGWRVSAAAHALRRVPPARIGVCRCRPDTSLQLTRDGLRLSADLYGHAGGPRPPILLLHGLTPYGNDLPLYRVLARRLADEGFLVLALDFAGFGGSDDPYGLASEDRLGGERDVRAALDAIDALPAAAGPVTLIGHSMGAFEAMGVGLADRRVAAVVAIGPPRRTAEILATEAGRDYHWDRIRRTYDSVYHRELPAWLTRDRFLASKARRDIEAYAGRWAAEGHVPLLLIDGTREDEKDRTYLRGYAARVRPPARYVTLDDADHYLNSGRIGGLVYYDRAAMSALVGEIRAWAARGRGNR
jgi:pimeloyl-ACP methyl ester carboxylesterase